MKNVKKLIDISERINCQGDYQKFFSFAGNYITKMKQEKRDNTEIFFNMVKTCENKYNTINVKLSMGISGAGNSGISASIEEIREHEYILTPGRYVGIEEAEADAEPFEEKMTRLTEELAKMFAKSHHLEEEIKQRLGAIGYEF